jgi:ferric-dicitrate binding protein FerR (iron transport regulator)
MTSRNPLISRYFDDDLSEAEAEELTAWLKQSSENAADFARQARLDYLLKRSLEAPQAVAVEGTIVSLGGLADAEEVIDGPRSAVRSSALWERSESRVTGLVVLATLLLVATLGGLRVWSVRTAGLASDTLPEPSGGVASRFESTGPSFEPDGNSLTEAVVEITGLKGVRWLAGHERRLGDRLAKGVLRFQQGTVRVRFVGGVVASIVGPAEVQLIAGNQARLIAGTFVAYAPEGAEGFRLDTPGAEITDLGTEFGARVDDAGETTLSVFDGEVQLVSRDGGVRETLTQGQGATISAAGVARPQFSLTPFEEPRDAIRGYRIVWEPFGPGSATGPFPGSAGAGWRGPWRVVADPAGGGETVSITNKQPLHPGAEWYLEFLGAIPPSAAEARLQVRRSYRSLDAFSVERPYTIECLVRLQSNPSFVNCFEVAGFLGKQEGVAGQPAWAVRALPEGEVARLRWQVAQSMTETLDIAGNDGPLVSWWEPFRLAVTIDPAKKRWRFMVASPQQSASSEWRELALSAFGDGEPHEIVVTARGDTPYRLSFAIDEVKIRNLP